MTRAATTVEAHQAGSEILVGLVDELVAAWDGLPARSYGGTADVVAYAERVGIPVRIIWPRWSRPRLISVRSTNNQEGGAWPDVGHSLWSLLARELDSTYLKHPFGPL